MKKLREAYLRYSDPNVLPNDRPTQVEISKETGIAQSTISYWFERFKTEEAGYSPDAAEGTGKKGSQYEGRKRDVSFREVAKTALAFRADKSRKDAEQVIIIGDTVMRGYSDLITIAIRKGMNIEDFIKEVFNFYEQKPQLTQYTTDLEAKITELEELTDPNWRYKQKSMLLYKFARDLLMANAYGAKINPKEAVRALQIELEKIDKQEMVV